MNNSTQCICAILSIGGKIGVAVFFIITGYFSAYKKELTVKPFMALLEKIHVYGLVMLAIFLASHYSLSYGNDFDLSKIVKKSVFIPSTLWWFAFSYIVLLFLLPSINKLLDNSRPLLLLFIIFFIWYFFYSPGSGEYKYYDFIKAVFFYLCGCLLRRTNDCYMRYLDNKIRKGILAAFILFMHFCGGWVNYQIMAMSVHSSNAVRKILFLPPGDLLNNILIPVEGILLFILFSNMQFKSNFINMIAIHVFGVYLLHDYPFTRDLLWSNILNVGRLSSLNTLFLPTVMLYTMAVFLFGIAVDKIVDTFIHIFDNAFMKYR